VSVYDAERASICSTRSKIRVRFGSPVSGRASARNGKAPLGGARACLVQRALRLAVEGLAHPHERHVEGCAANIASGLEQNLWGVPSAVALLTARLRSPRHHTAGERLGDLVQRGGALHGELTKRSATTPCQTSGLPQAGPPALQRATAIVETVPTRAKGVLDHRVECWPEATLRARNLLQNILRALVERLAEATKISPGSMRPAC